MPSKFGQVEPLTVRLRNLIQTYPFGVGIAKEFLQNADDAGASRFLLLADDRECPVEDTHVLSNALGPALLAYNDATFTDENFESIQRIADSDKPEDLSKTGRYGLGFNVCYNVSDTPILLSRDRVCIFDPHETLATRMGMANSAGVQLSLAEVWEEFPELGHIFSPVGLQEGQTTFEGTAFRFPIRSDRLAPFSKISQEQVLLSDIDEILVATGEIGAELLLFLRNVSLLEVGHVVGDDVRITSFAKIKNKSDVGAKRDEINKMILAASWQELLREAPGHCLELLYEQTVELQVHDDSWDESWLVVSGLYGGEEEELLRHAEEAPRNEKPIPLAGAAIRLRSARESEPMNGVVYCMLPLPGNSGLPVHLNGFLALDPSRQATSYNGSGLVGKDARRASWNSLLAEHGMARSYASLIAAYRSHQELESNVQLAYEAWPLAAFDSPHLPKGFRGCVFGWLQRLEVIRVPNDRQWMRPADVRILPRSWSTIHEPLVAQGFHIPEPRLPETVIAGFAEADFAFCELEPAEVRNLLANGPPQDCPPEESDFPCLKRPTWIASIIRFCMSDAELDECAGLPLALHLDGRLRNFGAVGFGEHKHLFVAGEAVHQVFSDHKEWFLDPSFASDAKINGDADLRRLGIQPWTPETLVSALIAYLENRPKESLNAEAPELRPRPTNEWLAKSVRLITDSFEDRLPANWLSDLRLIPDTNGALYSFGSATTPLISDKRSENLVPILTRIGVPIVGGDEAVKVALRELHNRSGKYVWPLTATDLIDTLAVLPKCLESLLYEEGERLTEFIVDGFEALEEATIQKAKVLPVFPANGSNLSAPSTPGSLLMPLDLNSITGFAKGLLLTRTLFSTGPDGKWKGALKQMGLKEADPSTIIEDLILPSYDSLPTKEKTSALNYIFRNLDGIRDLGDSAKSQRVLSKVRAAPLVQTEAHGFVNFDQLYAPNGDSYHVLAQGAPVPAELVYPWHRWSGRFASIEVATKPRARDIVDSIKLLIAPSTIGRRRIDEQLSRIFAHIQEDWEFLVKDGGELFVSSIRDLKWLPNNTLDRDLARYTCFKEFEASFYRPNEMAPANLGHLLAATMPIARFNTPKHKVAEALGIISSPSVTQISNQLEAICAAIQGEGTCKLEPQNIARSTQNLYRELGVRLRSESSIRTSLALRFSQRACIWDEGSQKMWLPSKCFKQSIPLADLRFTASFESTDIEAFMEAVGKRSEPGEVEYRQILDELHDVFGTSPLPPEYQEIVCSIWKALLGLGGDSQSAPVMDRWGSLRSHVYYDDLTDTYATIDLSMVPLRHPGLPDELNRLGRAVSLMRSLTELPTNLGLEANLRDDSIDQLVNWVRSYRFAEGLVRLLRPSNSSIDIEDLQFLESFSVQIVSALETEVSLNVDGEPLLLGMRVPKRFLSVPETLLYLPKTSLGDPDSHIADVLERILDPRFEVVGSKYFYKMVHLGRSTDAGASLATFLDDMDIPKLNQGEEIRIEDPELNTMIVREIWDESADYPRFSDEPIGESEASISDSSHTPTTLNEPSPSSGEEIPRLTGSSVFGGLQGSTGTGAGSGGGGGGGTNPPITPGHGRSSFLGGPSVGGSPSSRNFRLRTYVHLNPLSDYDTGESDGEDVALGREGERLVIEWERQQGRIATSMNEDRENHEGYDIESEGSQDKRYIEVKSIRQNWTQLGVGVTKAQKEAAERFGRSWWLYVVEYAGDSSKAIIHEIKNPFMQASEYRFDDGWREIADGSGENTGANEPVVGETYERGDGSPVTIKSCKKMGGLWLVEIDSSDGQSINVAWSPTWRKV